MTLILQGMRRSGTTIVYDVLAQDPALALWYEPLAAAVKPAVGGGSGARDVDPFEGLRAARQEFLAARGLSDPAPLNLGGPRDATLEFDREFPPLVADYLRFLLDRPGPVAAKFTRIYAKVPAVARMFPAAGFVHLVRDPRAVVASYLFGKGRHYENRFGPPDVFFSHRSDRTAWSSYPISELVRREYAGESLPEPTDLERILLVWRFTYERVKLDAARSYGERAIQLRHEDFCADPATEITRLYAHDGRTPPPEVMDWAEANVRPPGPIHAVGDPRWREAFERMRMVGLVAEAGYEAA
jgi:hypothetical protein